MTESNEQAEASVTIFQLTNSRENFPAYTKGQYLSWAYYVELGMIVEDSTSNLYLYNGINAIKLPDNWTDSSANKPQIFGKKIVWYSYDSNDSEIYLYDGIDTIQLTHNDTEDYDPQISGNNIAWIGSDGNDDEIFFSNGIDTIQLTENDVEDTNLQISGNNIVWSNSKGLFLYDGNSNIKLTDNYEENSTVLVSENNVVWVESNQIFLYNGNNTIKLTDNYENNNTVQVSKNNVIWSNSEGIFLYDGNNTTKLTDNYEEDSAPQLFANKVVWVSNDGNDGEIYVYDGSNTSQLTNNNLVDREPKISGNNVAWFQYNPAEEDESFPYYDLAFYDGNSTKILDTFPPYTNFDLSDRYIVWRTEDYAASTFIYDIAKNTQFESSTIFDASFQLSEDYLVFSEDDLINTGFLYDGTNIIRTGDYQQSGANLVWVSSDGNDKELFGESDNQLLNSIDNEIFLYDGTTTIQLTNNSTKDDLPQISGDNVVWLGNDGNDDEIFFYDGTTTTQLTDNDRTDKLPQISGDYLVWVGSDGNDGEIFLYDGAATTQLTNNSTKDDLPQISGDNVVWLGNDGNDDEIFFYDGTTIIQLTDNERTDKLPQISGDKVVWVGSDGNDGEIFLYDGAATTQLTNNNTKEDLPLFIGDYLVWIGNDGNDDEIFLYDDNNIIQLTNNDRDDYLASDYGETTIKLVGDQLVWLDSDTEESEIFLYDGNEIIQLTNNNTYDDLPQISGNKLAWSSSDGNDQEIYFYDGTTTIQLTDNEAEDDSPQLFGNKLVWSSINGDNRKILLYDGNNTIDLTEYYGSRITNDFPFWNDFTVWNDYLAWSDKDSSQILLSSLSADFLAESPSPIPISPSILINDIYRVERNEDSVNFVFTVSLVEATSETISVDYATENNTAIADKDYLATGGTLEFAPGEVSKTITVEALGDSEIEEDETFLVNLSNPVNGVLADSQGFGRIINDEIVTEVLINNVSFLEGDEDNTNLTFTVSLSTASTYPITVDYATENNTAIAGEDYIATNGTLHFEPGETSKRLTVEVISDFEVEEDESFLVNLSNPQGGGENFPQASTLSNAQATATITNEDSNAINLLNTNINRFQNTDVPNSYLFAGESESESIRNNFPNFAEEGLAFKVAVEPGDNLVPLYRFQSLITPGTYLFAGESESETIRQDFAESFMEEGLAFYVYNVGAGIGMEIIRFQNRDLPGVYLFATPEESETVRANFPNLVEEGIAFEVAI